MSKKPTEGKTKTITKTRPKRVPLGQRKVINASPREGYYRRLVTDKDNQIQAYLEAGYEIVSNEDTSNSSISTPSQLGAQCRQSVGGGDTGVLMEIPLELYNEDQKAKQDLVDEIEASYDPTKKIIENTYGTEFKRLRETK